MLARAWQRRPRLSPGAYRLVCLLALIALGFIVVTGAAVRLTGSGLGCSDWPTCEENQLVAALDQPHAMVEFVNRAITGLVSLAIMAAVLGSLLRAPFRRDLLWWSLGLVGGLIGQIVLGGITVHFELAPPFVMGHFALSMVLIWNAVVLHHRAGTSDAPATLVVAPPVRLLARVLLAVAAAVLFTGTMVTGAGPHGGDERVERLPLYIPDIAGVHGTLAITFLVVALAVLALLHRDGAPTDVHLRSKLLVAVIVGQAAIGYAQYFTGVPPFLVGMHVLGAVLVWVAALGLYLGLWVRPVERTSAVRTTAVGEPTGVGASS